MVIGSALIPPGKLSLWEIKVLKLSGNESRTFIGAVPFDINQCDDENYRKCGWYFDCWSSTLWSGPPHSYMWKRYGPRKENGEYIHEGDSVEVVVDTAKGELSFTVMSVNLGIAFKRIPLDKPLVPCVVLGLRGYSVKLI